MPDERRETSPQPTASSEWTVRRILEWTTSHLAEHGSTTPRVDAEVLLAHARKCQRIHLYARFHEVLTDDERAAMRELVKRRAHAEPVAHLVGHREFFSLDFRVTPDVLIPRPDTETLVTELLEHVQPLPQPEILEIGTGSGCIAITAAVRHRTAAVTAVDISPAALEIARGNAATHKVSDRIAFLEGDLFATVPAGATFDAIVSNPPYIRSDEIPELQPDVRLHEPLLALDGGADGLDIVRRIVAEAPRWLRPGGLLLIEIDPSQASAVQSLLDSNPGYSDTGSINDLTGRPRVMRARRSTGGVK